MYRQLLIGVIVGCAAAAVTCAFYMDLCSLIFRCGCEHMWGARDAHCNMHSLTGRHCPWCSIGQAGYGILFGGVVLAQLVLGIFPRRWSWEKRLATALAAFPVLGCVEGVTLGWITGYWN